MKTSNKLFSFKKFIAVGLSFVMFFQCSSLSFASENDGIKTYEDENVRVCSGLEECGYVICTFDKKSKKLEQKITEPKTGALLNLITFDLSKRTANSENTKIKSGHSRYTWAGYKYWTDTDPKINMIYCEIHGGSNKGVYLDMGSRESIRAAYDFADIVEDIADEELGISIETGLDTLVGLFFGSGVLVKIITEEAIKALGYEGSLVTRILNFHRLLLKAEGKFFEI